MKLKFYKFQEFSQWMDNNWSSYIAEAIATFALVFVGVGAVLAGRTTLGIALAHGLIIMCMVYATGHISGAHINPAVTTTMWLTKHIKTVKAIGYIISQLIGAVLAAIFLKIIYPSAVNLGTPTLSVSPGIGLLVEAVLTFFLLFTIYAVAVDDKAGKSAYGLAIGMVVTLDILAGGTLTGAAMNPARVFGPAVVSGIWSNHLVYWIGAIIGGGIAGLTYTKVMLHENK